MEKPIIFLTSNPQKAKDFSHYGFIAKEFNQELLEVLAPDVETVAMYKAKDTGLDGIVVEDTALYVDGAQFLGTEIKHVYDEIKTDSAFNERKAVWKVSLCMKMDDTYYLSTGIKEGKLKYPVCQTGYHFDKIFAVEMNGVYKHFEELSLEEKMSHGPRFKALKQLKDAIETNNFSKLIVVPGSEVSDWGGEYQVETTKRKNKFGF